MRDFMAARIQNAIGREDAFRPDERQIDSICEDYSFPCNFCGKLIDPVCVCSCPEAAAEHDAAIERRRTAWFVASGRPRLRCDECGQEPADLIHTTPDGMTFCDGCKGRRDRSRSRNPIYLSLAIAVFGVIVAMGLVALAAGGR